MMGRTHIITGAAVGAWYAALLPAAPDLVRIGCGATVAVAATFPDIDHHRGAVSTWFWPFSNLLSWAVRGAPMHILGWQWRLWPGVRHRGDLHRPRAALGAAAVGCLLCGAAATVLAFTAPDPLWAWWWAEGIAVGIGWAVHLLFDARTHSGIPVGANKHWTLGSTIRTGSTAEVAVRVFWWRLAWVSGIAAWAVTGITR